MHLTDKEIYESLKKRKTTISVCLKLENILYIDEQVNNNKAKNNSEFVDKLIDKDKNDKKNTNNININE